MRVDGRFKRAEGRHMNAQETTTTDAAQEIEIKLRLPPAARAALERHPALRVPRASLPETREQVTTYFDTDAGLLEQAGASLRVRRTQGGGLVQTLKLAPIAEGAAARRGEWEWPVGTETPDLARLSETPLAATAAALDGTLAPRYISEIRRTVRRIAGDDGTVIEAVMDEGRIRAGGREVAVNELELELKAGSPGALYRFALELAEAAPLAIQPASKAARGARLAGHVHPKAVATVDIALRPEMPAAEAFRCVVSTAVGHLRVNLEPAARGDAEGVHQLRVATRRVRAGIALFKPLLAPEAAARFNAELRRVGRVFAQARDWDVFVTETLPAAAADGIDAGWLHLLADAAAAARVAAHAEAARELTAPGFTLLLLGLSAWAEDAAHDPVGLGAPALAHPLRETAPALLRRLARRGAKRGKGIRHAGAAELHDVRKAMKTLRYGMEFTAALYRPKAVKAMLWPCKKLQNLLGEVNDAAATPNLARLLAEERTDLAPALGALAGWAERRGVAARKRVPKAWHTLRDADPFWE